jgi:hypothetical protein
MIDDSGRGRRDIRRRVECGSSVGVANNLPGCRGFATVPRASARRCRRPSGRSPGYPLVAAGRPARLIESRVHRECLRPRVPATAKSMASPRRAGGPKNTSPTTRGTICGSDRSLQVRRLTCRWAMRSRAGDSATHTSSPSPLPHGVLFGSKRSSPTEPIPVQTLRGNPAHGDRLRSTCRPRRTLWRHGKGPGVGSGLRAGDARVPARHVIPRDKTADLHHGRDAISLFPSSYLQGSDLQGSDLQGSDLQGSDLEDTTMSLIPYVEGSSPRTGPRRSVRADSCPELAHDHDRPRGAIPLAPCWSRGSFVGPARSDQRRDRWCTPVGSRPPDLTSGEGR